MPGDIFESTLIDKLEARVTALEEGGGGSSEFHLKSNGKKIKNIPSTVSNLFVRESSTEILLVTTVKSFVLDGSNFINTTESGNACITYTFSKNVDELDLSSVSPVSDTAGFGYDKNRNVTLMTNFIDTTQTIIVNAFKNFKNQIFK